MSKEFRVDEKWKLLITIFQVTFVVLLLLFMYMIVMCFIESKFSFSLLVLPFIILCLIMEKQLFNAKSKDNIKCINVVLRTGMRIVGMLY
ncbi:MAG: hypothetical protein RR624_01385 [Longicatena sp.]